MRVIDLFVNTAAERRAKRPGDGATIPQRFGRSREEEDPRRVWSIDRSRRRAASVPGPSHAVKSSKTPVLDAAEAHTLPDRIDITTHAGPRHRALIPLMVSSFARIGAAIGMTVEDVFTQTGTSGCN